MSRAFRPVVPARLAPIAAACSLAALGPAQDPTSEPAIRANAVVVSGVLPPAPQARGSRVLSESPPPDMGALLRALVLGDGGLGPHRGGVSGGRERAGLPRVARSARAGEVRTRGGVRVRAKAAGVKLDFPSRAELLIAPDGAVHLRDGGHTLAARRGLELWLMDGTRIVALPGTGRDDPLDSVEVHGVGSTRTGRSARLLWRGRQRATNAARARPRLGLCYLALGNGEVLYQATSLGPMLVLRRVLCPGRLAHAYPTDRVVVLGDLLARSLQALPDVVPPRPVQFPQAPEAAGRLASLSERWFESGVLLRPANTGAMVFPLDANFRLTVEDVGARGVVVAVRHAEAPIPVVEWLIGMRTELNLVRPDGGQHGGPRYFMRGLDLSRAIRSSWPVRPTARALVEARDALRRLGARPIDRTTAGG